RQAEGAAHGLESSASAQRASAVERHYTGQPLLLRAQLLRALRTVRLHRRDHKLRRRHRCSAGARQFVRGAIPSGKEQRCWPAAAEKLLAVERPDISRPPPTYLVLLPC